MRSGPFINAIGKAGESFSEDAILLDLWRQFYKEFPTEKDCLEEIYRRAKDVELLRCHYCGSKEIARECGKRVYTCQRCGKESWFTAGTFFHHMKIPRAWLGAIWLMEHGQSINSSKFHKLVGIAYSSALKIFKKLTMVIGSEMGGEAVEVKSQQFCPIFGKRSRETPARVHPVAEQQEIEKEEEEEENTGSQDRQEAVNLGKVSGKEKEVYGVLTDKPVHVDDLCRRMEKGAGELSASLMILELEGLAKRLAGDRYIRQEGDSRDVVQLSLDKEERTKPVKGVSAIIDYVQGRFHRVARKYVQNYLAAYWCYIDRARWKLGALLEACLRHRHISYKEILEYVSPYMVKMVPC